MTTVAADVLRQDIVEDAYRQLEKMITKICWKFTRKYGGEFEDWLSEAGELFMDAIQTYNGKASLTTWIWHRLHWGLYTVIRKRMRTSQREMSLEDMSDGEHEVEDILEAGFRQCFTAGLDRLDESGRELWSLIAEPPVELQGELDPDDPDNAWDALQRYCEYRLRWTWREMQTAIAELKELCQDAD